MTTSRRVIAFSIANVAALLASGACNVFAPPPLGGDAGPLNENGGSNSTGGTKGGDGGQGMSKGGADASVGGSASGAGTGGAAGSTSAGTGSSPSSGGVRSMEAGADAMTPSGPVDPWWPHEVSITYDSKKPPVMCLTEGEPDESKDRPKTSDPGDSIPPIYLAMNRMLLGSVAEQPDPNNKDLTMLVPDSNAWKTIGFDLDGACTNSSTCAINDTTYVLQKTCVSGGVGSMSIPYDGDNCLDNSIGKTFNLASNAPDVGVWFGLTEQDLNCELWRGGYSVIYKISNYNGQYNDTAVTVDLYTSPGLQSKPSWQCRAGGVITGAYYTNWYKEAPWLQKSHWKIRRDDISVSAETPPPELPDSKWQDNAAFVRGGWLIAHAKDGSPAWLDGSYTPTPGFHMTMHRNIMALKLVKDPQSGLWSSPDAMTGYVSTASEVLQGFQEMGFCENMCGTWDTVKGYLNTYLDMSVDPAASADSPCDSLSYGLRFRAAQVTVDASDVQDVPAPQLCGQPRHPDAPRQNCVCSADRTTCTLPDGG
jgi:hypothetical protein